MSENTFSIISAFCNQFDYEFGQTEPDDPEYCYYKFKAENHGSVGFPNFYANSPLELAQKMLGWKSAPYPTLMEHYEKTEKWKNITIKELEIYKYEEISFMYNNNNGNDYIPAEEALNINPNAYPYDRKCIGFVDVFDRSTGEIFERDIPFYEGDSIRPYKYGYGIYTSWSEDYIDKNYRIIRYEEKINLVVDI